MLITFVLFSVLSIAMMEAVDLPTLWPTLVMQILYFEWLQNWYFSRGRFLIDVGDYRFVRERIY